MGVRSLLIGGLWLVSVGAQGLAPLQAAGKKELQPVRAEPAGTYAARDSHAGVTIAAEPYETHEKSKAVFGKYDPLKLGVLPVFVVITNATEEALRLDNLEVQFITGDRRHVEPIPAANLSLRMKGRRPPPEMEVPRYPIPRRPERSDPHPISELVDREFVLKMVPPGDTVGGFLFFQLGQARDLLGGAHLYLPGITWARTGKPLMYFEVSFDDYLQGK